jgi:hypothetical protein
VGPAHDPGDREGHHQLADLAHRRGPPVRRHGLQKNAPATKKIATKPALPRAQLHLESKRLMGWVGSTGSSRPTVGADLGPSGHRCRTRRPRDWLTEPTKKQLQVRDVAELKLVFGEFANPQNILTRAREQNRPARGRDRGLGGQAVTILGSARRWPTG